MARYGSICVCGSPGRADIHSLAAWQAWKYSSSVESAGAFTDVVTPAAETPITGGAPEASRVWVAELLGAAHTCEDDEAAGAFELGEHATSSSAPAKDNAAGRLTAAVTERRCWLRMPTIYATLADVMERTGFRECCQAF